MKPKRKLESKTSVLKSIVGGAGVGLAISVVCAAIAAALISNGSVGENTKEYFAFAAMFLSAFIGTLISWGMVRQKPAQICVLVSAVYCFALVSINILAFDGVFENIGIGILMILLGCAGTCGLAMKRRGEGKRHKHMRFR